LVRKRRRWSLEELRTFSKKHAVVLMSFHQSDTAWQAFACRGCLPELAHAARGHAFS